MPQYDAEMLLDLLIPSNVRLSPSGQKLVYQAATLTKSGEHDISSIWLANVGEENSARQLTSGQFCDTNPEWSSDGKAISFLSDRAEPSKSSAIYLLSLEGGEAIPLTKAKHRRSIGFYAWES